MKKTLNSLILLLFVTLFSVGSVKAQSYVPLLNDTRMQVQPQITIKAYPLPLSQVKLLDGPFKTAMEAGRKWLMELEPNRFLHRFHENAGLPVKGEIYGGWENSTQSGFCFGHYISALSMLYAATGDVDVKTKLDYCINELKRCQDAIGTGYVGGVPGKEKIWNEMASGDFREVSTGWVNGIWVPWYNLHKLFAGLVDAYLYTGNETAKTVVIDLTDWACEKFKNLTDEQWQKMIYCETGGINDALYNIYAITGNPKHLALADKFYHKLMLDPLSERKDQLSGFHANTQIPKIIGAARSHELRNSEKDKTITTFFWDIIRDDHSYCIGGNSNHEHFEAPGTLSLSDKTTETCNTYNMLKLTRHLFAWEPSARYMDFYERALYNHILSSQNPETGMVVYYLPLAYNSKKAFCSKDVDFWCCVGTGFENHVKYAEEIYAENENELYVNLFIASELDWTRKNMKIRQETTFPDSDKSQLTITCSGPQRFTLHIRYPEWATSLYRIKINGELQNINSVPGSYISINRIWNNNDIVEIEMDKSLRKELLLGDDHQTAFLNGPIVLAATTNPNEKTIALLDESTDIYSWIKPTDTNKTTFKTETGLPSNVDFIPFYKKYEGYYSIYLDCYSPEEWDAVKEEYEAEQERLREIERLTLDYFYPNEQQSEIDHNFKGNGVGKGDGSLGKKWCDTNDYFSFELKVDPLLPAGLLLTYWGSDGGDRKFNILIDNELIATEELTGHKPNEYFDRTYSIPFHLTKDKNKVTVKLQAQSGNKAGGIFFARMMLKKEMAENITVTDYFLPKSPYLSQHKLEINGSGGTHKGHPWIDTYESDQLSFDMNCMADKPMYLLLSYWGSESSRRKFDILVENTKIAVQELYMNRPEELYDVVYEIPASLSTGKNKLRVGLKGDNGSKAGGLFYAYTFSREKSMSIETVKADTHFPLTIEIKDSKIILKNISEQPVSGMISLSTISGQLLYTRFVNISNTHTLDVNMLKGVYILAVKSGSWPDIHSAKIAIL